MLENVVLTYGGEEVSAMSVYTSMFFLGDGLIQCNGEPSGSFKANPIGYYQKDGKGYFRVFFEDTFSQTLEELQEADFAIMNGLTYFGRRNRQDHASKMYAMILDYDGVTDMTLYNFLKPAFNEEFDIYPVPNYIVLSGNNVHLYYLFEKPIPLYPNMKLQLKALKYALIDKIWNKYTSEEKKQFQGINQGFRPIGGKTKRKGVRVRAFALRARRYSLLELSRYVPEESRVDDCKLYKENRMTLDEAKKKYPQWYQDKVINKQERRYWTVKKDLYEWWKRQMDRATYHHRYFFIMCLAIYGVKCDVGLDTVRADAFGMIPFLNAINPSAPFTEQDVESALECYDPRYCTFPILDIEKLSGIAINRNKRNWRKQYVHLRSEIVMDENTGRPKVNTCCQNRELALRYMRECKEIKGRPRKQEVVQEWRRQHPKGKKAECIRDTGLSKPTVYRWWNNSK